MATVKLQLTSQPCYLFLLFHQLIHQTLQILRRNTHYSFLILSGMFSGCLFLEFLRSGFSVVSSYLFLVLALSPQAQWLFGWSALIVFIIFGDAFSL